MMLRRAAAFVGLGLLAAALSGCPKTQFFNEASGQPTDRASGKAPPGSVGACRRFQSLRPPIVNKALWDNLKMCNARTPRRYMRIGFGRGENVEKRRLEYIMGELTKAAAEEDGNVRMLLMLRAVRGAALDDKRLKARVERASGRTFVCDYAYLLNTTRKQYSKVSIEEDACPAYAFDPKTRRDVCLFDTSIEESRWLTSSWGCLAFTETVGEGNSCHRLCAYDDYCTAQVSCSQADFDLALCALGVCMPEKVQVLF